MKNVLKRSLSFLLAITIIFGSVYTGLSEVDWDGFFGVKAGAEDNIGENGEDSEADEYIYYSDLFYGYSHYLVNDPFFNGYSASFRDMNDTVYNAYKNSALVVGTGLENALDVITSPTEITMLITDAFGITDISYTDALDAANDEFVCNILSDSLEYDTEKAFGKVASINEKLSSIVAFFNNLKLEDGYTGIEYTAEYFTLEAFEFLQDIGVFNFVSDTVIATLWNEIYDEDFKLSECFSTAATEIDIAQAIVVAIMMEDARIEIVDDIIASQKSDTILKIGMVRLKNKLEEGFVAYFIKNYLVEKLIDDVLKVIDGFVENLISSKQIYALVNVVKKAFKTLFNVPTLDMILKWRVLMCYSNDLSSTISNFTVHFFKDAFLSDEIPKFESIFIAYDAVNKSTLSVSTRIANMLDPYGEAYAVLVEAVNNNIETVTIKTGAFEISIPSTTSDEELYDILTVGSYMVGTSTISFNKVVTVSNGITTVKVCRKLNQFASVLSGCINESWGKINDINTSYGGISLFGEYINSVKTAVYNTPVDERKMVPNEICCSRYFYLEPNVRIVSGSDEIKPNHVYLVENTIFGCLCIVGDVNVIRDIIIAGDFISSTVTMSNITIKNGVSVTVNNNLLFKTKAEPRQPGGDRIYSYLNIDEGGTLKVVGDFDISGAEAHNWYHFMICNVNGTVNIGGSFIAEKECGIWQTSSTSHIKVKGNFLQEGSRYIDNYRKGDNFSDGIFEIKGDCNSYIKAMGMHTVVFSGDTQQTITNLNAQNVILGNTSKDGIVFSGINRISGNLKFNDNIKIQNGINLCLDGGTLEGHSWNGDITVAGDITFPQGDIIFRGDFVSNSLSVTQITVGKGTTVTVDNFIYKTKAESRQPGGDRIYSYLNIDEGGTLKVVGDFNISGAESQGWYHFLVCNINGDIEVCGTFTAGRETGIWQTSPTSYIKVNGNFIQEGSRYIDNYRKGDNFANGTLEIGGDCSSYVNAGGTHTTILSGVSKQTINGGKFSTLVFNNTSEDGVEFTNNVKTITLFNHNGNLFTLYNNGTGSTFVDYDGDGMKDNVDPEPTVGNPCTITVSTEDKEKGTVSDSFDSVGGTKVTVVAEPTFKYDFYCWKNSGGKILSYNANYSFVATDNTTLTAYFTKRQRNITVDTENGTFTVSPKAEIESIVTVTPVPEEGCLYIADSITVNGETITGNSFIMPDEDVVLSAEFVVNDNYFALKDALTEAENINQTIYSKQTANVLQAAIVNAKNSLKNDVSQIESEARVVELQNAIYNLVYAELPIEKTDNSVIDFDNFIIRTSVNTCDDIGEIITVSQYSILDIVHSYSWSNFELYGTGTVISVYYGNNYIGDFTLIVEGDTNGDSVCDALDAAQVALASNGHENLDGAYALAADSNSDDIVDINDYQQIVNKAVS